MRGSVLTTAGQITLDSSAGVANRLLLTDASDNVNITGKTVVAGGLDQIGYGTTGPSGTNGSAGKVNVPNAYTALHTLKATENFVTEDSTSAGYAVTLPPVASSLGQEYTIINIGTSNAITLTGNSSDNIQVSGGSAANTYSLAALTVVTLRFALNHAGTAVWWVK